MSAHSSQFYDFDGRKDEMQEGPLLSWGCNSIGLGRNMSHGQGFWESSN